jgi:hypothetical protein
MRRSRHALPLLILIAVLGKAAFGQGLGSAPSSIFSTPDDLKKRHMAPTGKPCLAFEASAKAQIINKDIYEHWISAKNSCGQHIKVQVCYHQTRDCITMDIPPWGQQDSVLGIYPALKEFQFDAREQF